MPSSERWTRDDGHPAGAPIVVIGAASPKPRRWATVEDCLIVRAAVSDGDQALAAWQGYCALVGGIERAQGEAFTLLPLVYRNLQRSSYEGSDLGRLKGIYRHAWYANSIHLRAAAQASAGLRSRGVEPLLIGRAALLSTYPAEVGTRPMEAADVLIRPTEVARAMTTLRAAGWSDSWGSARGGPVALMNEGSVELKLHRGGFPRRRGLQGRVWADAINLALGGTDVLVPSPADQLLLISASGFARSPARLGGIVDALLLVGANDRRIAWDELVARAEQFGMTLPLADALGFLAAEFALDVPSDTISGLRAARGAPGERLRRRIALNPWREGPLWGVAQRSARAWSRR